MTLARAIEILTIDNDHNPNYTDAERQTAHDLSIEAMKRVKTYKEAHVGLHYEPMPGETPENENDTRNSY